MSEELIEGAYYRWHFKDKYKHKSDPYWCRTCIGFVSTDGQLYDIYLSSEKYRVPLDKVNIKLIAHKDDIEPISERDSKDYDEKDIVYMHNPNTSRFGPSFLRKGAIKSKTKILEALRRDLADIEDELKELTGKRYIFLAKIKEQDDE